MVWECVCLICTHVTWLIHDQPLINSDLFLQHCCLSWSFISSCWYSGSFQIKETVLHLSLQNCVLFPSRPLVLFVRVTLSSNPALQWVCLSCELSANLKSTFTILLFTSLMKILGIPDLAQTPLQIHLIHSPIRQWHLLSKCSFPTNCIISFKQWLPLIHFWKLLLVCISPDMQKKTKTI